MDSVEPPRPVSALPDPASSRDSFLPRESKPSPQPDAGCAPAAMKELLDSDRVNYLVWRFVPTPCDCSAPGGCRLRALAGARVNIALVANILAPSREPRRRYLLEASTYSKHFRRLPSVRSEARTPPVWL